MEAARKPGRGSGRPVVGFAYGWLALAVLVRDGRDGLWDAPFTPEVNFPLEALVVRRACDGWKGTGCHVTGVMAFRFLFTTSLASFQLGLAFFFFTAMG